ncbi:MAG: hypothetical protein RL217_806 [Pseudomonadota bacterium]|jgi:ferredoxin-NADP reductase
MLFNRIALLATALLLCSTVAWSAEHHHEIDWARTLTLTSTQQQQIKTIEAKYRDRLKALHSNCNAKKQQHYLELQEQMRLEIRQILRPAQQETAQNAMFEHRRLMQLQQAKEVAHAMDMSAAQKEAFFTALQQLTLSAQWPMTMVQQEQAREQFKALVKAYSSAAQWQKWQQQQTNSSKKWHKMDEFRPACAPTS